MHFILEPGQYPILRNITFSKEDIEIIKETFQEIKKEYPSDDLLSTYIDADPQTIDNMLKVLSF